MEHTKKKKTQNNCFSYNVSSIFFCCWHSLLASEIIQWSESVAKLAELKIETGKIKKEVVFVF